ncbi:MAG: hypothetical protein WC822_02405 [Candidatus Paceibacterota bacterium]|jgi:chromosome segregation ATPase
MINTFFIRQEVLGWLHDPWGDGVADDIVNIVVSHVQQLSEALAASEAKVAEQAKRISEQEEKIAYFVAGAEEARKRIEELEGESNKWKAELNISIGRYMDMKAERDSAIEQRDTLRGLSIASESNIRRLSSELFKAKKESESLLIGYEACHEAHVNCANALAACRIEGDKRAQERDSARRELAEMKDRISRALVKLEDVPSGAVLSVDEAYGILTPVSDDMKAKEAGR